MMFVILSFLSGMLLGQRFRVPVLFPAIALVLFGTIVIEIARGEPASSLILLAILVSTALEGGYLIGTTIRSFRVAGRASRTSYPQNPAPRPGKSIVG